MTTVETSHTPDRGYMGDRRRGASLGRANRRGDTETAQRFRLRRVHLDSGGYDRGGAYWGHGGQLWEAFSANTGDEYMTFRIYRRDEDRARIVAVMRRRFGTMWIGRDPTTAKGKPRSWTEWLDRMTAKRRVRADYPNARFYR